MTKHRSHSIEFKRQVAQEFLGGETQHGLAKRHDISRNLIRVWVEKYDAGAFDDDAHAADLIPVYKAHRRAVRRPTRPGHGQSRRLILSGLNAD
jgi:transposase